MVGKVAVSLVHSLGRKTQKITQNYGCLPCEYDIIKMKGETGHNWACHYDETVMCGGFARHVKKNIPDLDLTKGGVISYDTWYREG